MIVTVLVSFERSERSAEGRGERGASKQSKCKKTTKWVPALRKRETVNNRQGFIDWKHWAQLFLAGTDDPLPYPPRI